MSQLHTPFRFDYVGSFLRPETLRQARASFAAGEIGNKLTGDEQWAKLELVRDIAGEVWGAE